MLNALYQHRMKTYAKGHFSNFFETIALRGLGDVGLLAQHQHGLRTANVPTLLLYGEHDAICDPKKMANLADAIGPDCALNSVPSGHSFAKRNGKGIFRVATKDICAFLLGT